MDWLFPFAVMVSLVLCLMGLGLPVAFAFFATNIAGLYLFFGGSVGVAQMIANFSDAVATYALTPLPLFLVMGSLFFRSGLGDGVIRALDLCIGGLRARLSYVVLAAGAVFSALSGSSIANTGMMGALMVPEMLKRGYKPRMAFGPVLGAGSLAVIIPPSTLAVLLGSLAQIDVGALLIAGAIPGLLLTLMFAALIFVQTLIDPESAPQYATERPARGAALKAVAVNIVPMGVIVFLVVGTIILGIATPTESAALGCAGVLGLLLAYRKFRWSVLWEALDDAMKVTGMTFLIISASTTFSQVFAFSGASAGFINTIVGFDPGPYTFLLLMILVIIILGMFMDQVSMMLITLPIFLPIAMHFQFDLVWFGLILLLTYEIGFTSPPFGLLLFIMLGVAPKGTSLSTVALAAAPYIACTLFLILLIILFPKIALFLPGLL
ncbi:TRAP transporter large permease [Nitratireductor soli]|uniref:TRAP transporter large permease n=1 Tax=Nitratireductor soli TaxID=1670619 RepID=UPI00065E3743|nr:TRAP transporter large permease subunit [Nitratireductor soli]